MKITHKQQQILDYIQVHLNLNGFSPSIKEIGAAVGLSITGTAYHLNQLEEGGVISRVPNQPRAIRIEKTK